MEMKCTATVTNMNIPVTTTRSISKSTSTPMSTNEIYHQITFILLNKDLACKDSISINLKDSDLTHKIPQNICIDGIEVGNKSPDYKSTADFYLNLHEVCTEKYDTLTEPINDWLNDPEYNTVAIVCNDVLAFPDVMFNLTCGHSHPKEILEILDTIHANLSTALNMPNLKKPNQRFHWYEDRLCIYLNTQLEDKKHTDRMHVHAHSHSH